MSSIGGRTVISITGDLDLGTGERLEDITRANVDGRSFRKVGKMGTPFEVTTVVDLVTAGAAASEFEAYEGLQGTLVSVVDDTGQTVQNVAVLDVRRTGPVVRVVSPVGGVNGGGYLLTARWSLVATDAA